MQDIEIAEKLVKGSESCARKRADGRFEAYCDPYSAMGKALQARGLWLKYIHGSVEIPADLRKLSGSPWTIGWGQTGAAVVPGLIWTQEQCDAALRRELAYVKSEIVGKLLKRAATANQLGAMISLAYNIGLDIDEDTKAEGLGDSTLLRKFNAGDIQGAADGFMSWVYAGGVKSNGLFNRRTLERSVFLGGSP